MIDCSQLMRARVAAGLSLAEAASAIGVGRSAVSLLEGGLKVDPDLAAKLKTLYESMGVEFGPNGMIGFTPGLVKGTDLGTRH